MVAHLFGQLTCVGFVLLRALDQLVAEYCRRQAQLAWLADGDTGYGNAINVQRTIRAYGLTGAAAVLIEDKAWPRPLGAGARTRQDGLAHLWRWRTNFA